MTSSCRAVCLALVVVACGSGAQNPPASDGGARADGSNDDGAAPQQVTDFAAPGPHAVTESSDSLATAGCDLEYTLYEPESVAGAPLVVLGHGFSRSQAQMVEVARHLASHGVRVATPDYCHLSAFDTDHVANGADAVALSAALADGAFVAHVGYSAGGLAGFLAAGSDPLARAYVGLDMVDADDLAIDRAPALGMAAFGLLGEPSMCNSDGNGGAVYRAASVPAVRIAGATHCDFEEPTNGLCTSFCGGETGAIATTKALATAFVSAALNLDPTASEWVEPGGSEYDRLVAAGTIIGLSSVASHPAR